MMMRARALAALERHASRGEAADIEHACFCIAALNGVPYSRFFFRALYALETPGTALLQIVRENGAMCALALPDSALFERVSARERVLDANARKAECAALLQELANEDSSGGVPLPEEKGVRCARCHSTDISFEFSQTRSADEGTTVFCHCTKCSKRWKM